MCYANRELSWLKFNERVLEEAEDSRVPLCERLGFISIFQSNLDEFFAVRVGSLYDQMLLSEDIRENKTNMTSGEQIEKILERTKVLNERKNKDCQILLNELRAYGAELVSFKDISDEDALYLKNYFYDEIRPLLSPQIVGKKQPFPFLKDKEIYAAVTLERKDKKILGIVPCNPVVFERLIPLKSNSYRFMLAEELILHFVPEIFDRYVIKSKSLIRITRSADIELSETDDDLTKTDYRKAMEKLVKKRTKLAPLKMEFTRYIDESIIDMLCHYLDLGKKQIFHCETGLDMSFLFQIADKVRDKKELFYEKRSPRKSPNVAENMSMIEQIKKKDILLHYPYESMKPFLRLLEEAGGDKDVVSIKMTLYRVAKNSKIVESLIEAAENGKNVVVLVELRARFDEENNIEWSRRLEDAGCTIIYGLDGLKVHSKLCHITRRTSGGIEYITQIGTGNYNEKTSTLYTDFSLMTASQEIGEETGKVFESLLKGETMHKTKHLLVAPHCLQNKITMFIDDEIKKAQNGEDAYIGIKINSLTDKVIIDKLIEASKAGVKIDLIVRGICCLISGIPHCTENINVISIVGRYLEHSRIYIFGKPNENGKMFISSADFMTRNTTKRVEVAVPIYDEDIRKSLYVSFNIMLMDNIKARVQTCNNIYVRKEPAEDEQLLNAQEYFFKLAYKNSNSPL